METEYVVLINVCKMVKLLRQVVSELEGAQQPTSIYQDNLVPIELVNGGMTRDSSRRKHINVWYNFTDEMVQEKGVVVEKIATENMKSDFLR